MSLDLDLDQLWHTFPSRLMRLHQRINAVSLLLICMQIVILSLPSMKMPSLICIAFEWTMNFIWVNRNLSGLTIALGR